MSKSSEDSRQTPKLHYHLKQSVTESRRLFLFEKAAACYESAYQFQKISEYKEKAYYARKLANYGQDEPEELLENKISEEFVQQAEICLKELEKLSLENA